MADHIESNEILREFAQWAARAEGDPYCERIILLSRALGIEASAHCRFESSGVRAARTADQCWRNREPLLARFTTLIESMARTRYVADRSTTKDGAVYIIPWWLAWTSRHRHKKYPSLHVTIGKNHPITIREAVTGEKLDYGQLHQVLMRHRGRSKLRREYLSSAAMTLLDDLEMILGTSSLASDWLRRMIDDPVSVENDALEIWSRFITDCDLPSSFRICGRTLSLGDLMILTAGSEGGRHRYSFAEQHPWAARALFRGPNPHETFVLIDRNPANSIKVSAQFLCCGNDGTACDKAVRFAKSIARHRHDPSIDRLLGTERQIDRQIRSLLMEAHEQDHRELLTHIGSNVEDARRQIEHTIPMIYVYRDRMGGCFACAYAIAALMIRTMVRNRIDSQIIDPELVLSGLVTMSADCLAAFASERLSDPSISSPEPNADSLDIGVLAFVATLGHTRKPQLTALQLTKFAKIANQRGIHKISAVKDHLDASWCAPSGWPTRELSDPREAMRISAVTSIKDLLDEGRRMKHCLADGRYNRAAVLGRLAFFSILVGRDRATLSLRPLQRLGSDGETFIDRWEVDQLRSIANSEPSSACKNAAQLVIQRLNAQCPYSISCFEISRRERIRAAMDESRGINADVVSAQQRWDEIYVKLLPRRLASLTPSRIVDDYLIR